MLSDIQISRENDVTRGRHFDDVDHALIMHAWSYLQGIWRQCQLPGDQINFRAWIFTQIVQSPKNESFNDILFSTL